MFGCAAKPSPETQESASTPREEIIQLECKAANHLGCRYRGRVYPWNAWVEVQGYDSKIYKVVEITQKGPRADIQIIER